MDTPSHKFAFGVYEADPASGELRKNGMKVRIQEQPFQILLMLLEHPGEVITREQLRLRLWPADTFVDFDHGLNTAINKLREAVGDSASNPRFVETLARRGYRFIAPVKVIEPPSAAGSSVATGTRPVPASQPDTSAPDASQPRPDSPSSRAVAADARCPVEASQRDNTPAATEISTPAHTVEQDLPHPSRHISRLLFGLIQIMYLIFYGVALVRLEHIPEIADDFLGRLTVALIPLVLVTAAVGIAMRLYLVTAVTFDYKPLGEKFRKLFPAILPLDQLWALSPFLLIEHIGIGGAFAACAALLYLPFSERTLIRMGYRY
jgi:DNA-binding winged helix-turn-helix (wHTH) protein